MRVRRDKWITKDTIRIQISCFKTVWPFQSTMLIFLFSKRNIFHANFFLIVLFFSQRDIYCSLCQYLLKDSLRKICLCHYLPICVVKYHMYRCQDKICSNSGLLMIYCMNSHKLRFLCLSPLFSVMCIFFVSFQVFIVAKKHNL